VTAAPPPIPENSAAESPPAHRRRWLAILALASLVGIVLVAVVFGVRQGRFRSVLADTEDLAQWRVSVTHPKRAEAGQRLLLPATIRAYTETMIYARVDGYLKRRHVDIGSRVRAGDLLAELDTPEADQQLRQARADLATAEANARLAEATARRYGELVKRNFVSRQDADAAQRSAEARRAEVQSARFNVRRLEEIQSFKRIVAPFAGVITVRGSETGMLVDSGSNGGAAKALFALAATERLRVQVALPQAYSRLVTEGLSAEFSVAEIPGQTFQGRLVRSAEAIDLATRTLLIEFEADNRSGALLTGAHAQAHIELPASANALLLPVDSLLFRPEGPQVAVVVPEGLIRLIPVKMGRDFGREVEITEGLKGDESVVADPPDSLISGARVRIVQPGKGEHP
jgi:RND family efflux transporter MFP subunit